MNVVKTTLGRLALYALLLAVNIIPCASILPDKFPTRNVSTLYLLILSACLIRYYSYRVSSDGALPFMMKSLSWMAFLLLLLRGVKYSVFAGVAVLARHTWYAYYVPMLLLPLSFFYISLLVSPKGDARLPKKWLWPAAVTAVFILLVLTNDLHQLVFRFQPGFVNWDGAYSYGWLFYVVTAWQYALYPAAVLLLVFKCRIGSAKKYAWLTVIPFSIGIAMSVLLMTGRMPRINGSYIIEFPEALIFMVTGVLECCIQLGLIPTNKGYGKLFRLFSFSAQITDREGTPVYLSRSAVPLTAAQFAAPDGAHVGEHTVQHKMEVPGGFGFWQDDLTELDRLNRELAEAKEGLAQEAELIRLRNELKEKQIKIEQRSKMYDRIARRTWRQSQAISHMAETARKAADPAVKETCRRHITLLAAYIKRFANLMLLSYESRTIETGELGLSFSEVLRYLNFSGVPGELFRTADGAVSAEAALAVFEAFGTLLTENLSSLRGVFVNLSRKESVVCKLTLEQLRTSLPEEENRGLARAGVRTEAVREDDVTYVGFTLPERGRAV
ncbi:MAG: hypothetical protein IKI50_02530 [Clostridia bacterium]|nr:hypothetical protein [Clostridia bacterium]